MDKKDKAPVPQQERKTHYTLQPAASQQTAKPDCQLIGENGNIFNLIGVAARALRDCGLDAQAKEMKERIMGGNCHDYYEALNIIGDYVNITGPEETDIEMGGMEL